MAIYTTPLWRTPGLAWTPTTLICISQSERSDFHFRFALANQNAICISQSEHSDFHLATPLICISQSER